MLRFILAGCAILLIVAVFFIALSFPVRIKLEDMLYEFALFMMRHRLY
ncbi:hypothetical protein ACMGGR_12050 [Erwinia sp. BNK-24-b]|nr:hypothetical protein [Erwinia phyllosphaerae]MBV4366394.1 hypothetical protein [Erwinia phyllosphaerae]